MSQLNVNRFYWTSFLHCIWTVTFNCSNFTTARLTNLTTLQWHHGIMTNKHQYLAVYWGSFQKRLFRWNWIRCIFCSSTFIRGRIVVASAQMRINLLVKYRFTAKRTSHRHRITMDEWLGKSTSSKSAWPLTINALDCFYGYNRYTSILYYRPQIDCLMCGYIFIYIPIIKQPVVNRSALIIMLWLQQIFA